MTRHEKTHAARRYIWTATDATGHRELVATIPDADGDHVNADARLIAAAPELLAALVALVGEADLGEVDFDDDDRAKLDVARAAIVKATGAA